MADSPVKILELEPTDGDVFAGRSLHYPMRRVFGGQILAQSVIAAGRTVEPPAKIHSLHGYFLLPGDPGAPIRFAVDRLRDGRSFHARRIDATQNGQLIATVLTSFQLPAAGPAHQDNAPALPPPDGLAARHPFTASADPIADAEPPVLPVELRPVPPDRYPDSDRRRVAALWLRITATLPDSPLVHAALLALLSDFSILRSALRAHGFGADRSRIKTASIDHSLWFHRPCRADEWLLYDLASPSASGARASGIGRMFTETGILAATSAQEGMFRVIG